MQRKIVNDKFMRKRYVFNLAAMLMVLASAAVWANPVSKEQAKLVATEFMTGKTMVDPQTGRRVPRRVPAQSEIETKVVLDATDREGQPLMYAVNFTKQGGFVLVSGDDRFNRVLGYSDAESFDEQDMPENMREWLQGYVEEMNYLTSIDYKPLVRRTTAAKAAIEPLIETKWNQGSPYNDLCPIDKSGQRSVTGCVATAMAQLVNYHIQHSDAPTALIADIPGYKIEAEKITMDTIPAGTAIPDKSLLLNTYGGSATAEEKEAVAQLMLYCGVSVKMSYNHGGSGASSSLIPQALIDYFGFDSTAHNVYRTDYTADAWRDLLYEELAAGRPMEFSGSNTSGGHAFVMDGFDGTNMFHINWGWGGSNDGYFALSVMNPNDGNQPGAGHSGSGYAISQHAVLGIQINTGEKPAPATICLTPSNLRVDGQKAVFAAYNRTGEVHSFDYGIGYLEGTGEITPIGYFSRDSLKNNSGWATLTYDVPTNTDYANTTRKIIPISREKGVDSWCPCANTDKKYFLADFDADGVPSLTVHPTTDLKGNSVSVPSDKCVANKQTVRLSLTNNGDEYYGALYLFVSADDSIGSKTASVGVTALVGSTQDVIFYWTPDSADTYNLTVTADSKGENVLATTSVTIKDDPGYAGKTLAVSSIKFDGQDENSLQIDATTGVRTVDVYATVLNGSFKLMNLSEDTVKDLKFILRCDPYNESTGDFDKGAGGGTYTANIDPESNKVYTVTNRIGLTVGTSYRLCIAGTSPDEDLDAHFVIRLLDPALRYTSTLAAGVPDSVYWMMTPNAAVAGKTIDLTYVGLNKVKSVAVQTASNPEGTAPTKIADNHWQYTMPAEDVTVKAAYLTEYAGVTAAPTAVTGLKFDGKTHALISAGEAENGTMYYSLDTYHWSTDVPVAISGQQTVYYKVVGDADHLDFIPSPNTIQVAITDFAEAGTADDPYLLPSDTMWNRFASLVNNGTSFEGKYFSQTKDISVTTMVGTETNPFKGVYDGEEHTLTVDLHSTEKYTAPFHYISGATIKNLRVAGTITAEHKFTGGIVGEAICNNSIINCRAGVTINSTIIGDGTHGGVVGLLQGDKINTTVTTVKGCIFDGKLLGDSTTSSAGFVGWSPSGQQISLQLTNNLFAPQEVTFSTTSSKTLARGSNITITNCYYAQTFGSIQGKQMYTITASDGVEVENAGDLTVYNVSGIRSYGVGIKFGDALYGGKGDSVRLNLSGSSNYKASAGTLVGSGNSRILVMKAAAAVIYGAASVVEAPTAKELTYTGKSQALVNAGTADGGTMKYSLDNSKWTTSIPTGKEVGDYTVYYMVVGDATHADYIPSPNTVAVTIANTEAVVTPGQDNPVQSTKVIENGVLYIIRGGKVYNVQGVRVK